MINVIPKIEVQSHRRLGTSVLDNMANLLACYNLSDHLTTCVFVPHWSMLYGVVVFPDYEFLCYEKITVDQEHHCPLKHLLLGAPTFHHSAAL